MEMCVVTEAARNVVEEDAVKAQTAWDQVIAALIKSDGIVNGVALEKDGLLVNYVKR